MRRIETGRFGRSMRIVGLTGALALLWGTGCQQKTNTETTPSTPPAKEETADKPGKAAVTSEVTFTTADGWKIHAEYTDVPAAKKAVVLLHQRNGSAADWKPVLLKLTGAGLSLLALDQRGAGRSTGPHNGDDAPWDTSGDIAAAIQWLGTKGFKPENIGLAGASYGANNALIYAAKHPETPAVALLSPGVNYHGLDIQPSDGLYKGRLLLLSAQDDKIMEGGPGLIVKNAPHVPEQTLFTGDSHGTDLFATHPESIDILRSFFANH